MKKIQLALAISALVLGLNVICAAGQGVPDISMQGELTEQQRHYLDVQGDSLVLTDIQAQFLLIEVYSLYCGPCRREAPAINAMYARTHELGIADAVKFIGIAAGNTPYEVNVFREKYGVPFPLFPDEDFRLHTALGNMGIPGFIFLRLDGEEGPVALLVREGAPEHMEQLFDSMLELMGRSSLSTKEGAARKDRPEENQ